MILQWWTHVIIHLSKIIECTIPRVSHNVSYGLWMLTCQCRFISCNKCISLVQDVDIGRGYVCHLLNGHGFEQTPGDSEGQGSLVCCSPWGHKEYDILNDRTTCVWRQGIWELYFLLNFAVTLKLL